MTYLETLADHEILDDILRHLLRGERTAYDWETIRKEVIPDEPKEIVQMYLTKLMHDEKVNWKKEGFAGGFFTFTTKETGKRFLNSGGYKVRFEKEQAENKRLLANQVIKDAKLRSDARLSNLQADHFWKIFGVAFIGGLVGIFTLVLELEDRGYITLPIELRKSQSIQDEASTKLEVSTDTTMQNEKSVNTKIK
ncbi:MAG: hypothetical protein KBF73_11210 [Flavobacteriales bacterium]|nr:hypothetical protein [Flavobacteriales bacterium]